MFVCLFVCVRVLVGTEKGMQIPGKAIKHPLWDLASKRWAQMTSFLKPGAMQSNNK